MTETTEQTGVIALTADLMFTSKISGIARALEVPCAIARDPEDLLNRVRQCSPCLVLMDFSHPVADWESLLAKVRSLLDPHKGDLIAFTTHVAWKSTRPYHLFCHRVLTQEALVQELPTLLKNAPVGEEKLSKQSVEVLEFEKLRNELEPLSPEIARRVCYRGDHYEIGIISFQPQAASDPKQIIHTDKDVVCHVLSGRGRLGLNKAEKSEVIPLKAGSVIRILSGIPHDFAATGQEELVIWYTLVTATSPARHPLQQGPP